MSGKLTKLLDECLGNDDGKLSALISHLDAFPDDCGLLSNAVRSVKFSRMSCTNMKPGQLESWNGVREIAEAMHVVVRRFSALRLLLQQWLDSVNSVPSICSMLMKLSASLNRRREELLEMAEAVIMRLGCEDTKLFFHEWTSSFHKYIAWWHDMAHRKRYEMSSGAGTRLASQDSPLSTNKLNESPLQPLEDDTCEKEMTRKLDHILEQSAKSGGVPVDFTRHQLFVFNAKALYLSCGELDSTIMMAMASVPLDVPWKLNYSMWYLSMKQDVLSAIDQWTESFFPPTPTPSISPNSTTTAASGKNSSLSVPAGRKQETPDKIAPKKYSRRNAKRDNAGSSAGSESVASTAHTSGPGTSTSSTPLNRNATGKIHHPQHRAGPHGMHSHNNSKAGKLLSSSMNASLASDRLVLNKLQSVKLLRQKLDSSSINVLVEL